MKDIFLPPSFFIVAASILETEFDKANVILDKLKKLIIFL